MSGLFGSTLIKGTRITDFSAVAVSVGEVIPWGYGAFRVPGRCLWANLPPTTHRNVQKVGKGSTKQETFTYTSSYAIGFCFGPVFRFVWIKRNGKVVYTTDPSAPIEDQAYAAKWAQKVNFHYGTPDQLPDSLIESIKGTGNVSAMKRWCYISVEDEDTTAEGGAIPTYEACVVASPPNVYLTSKPYPIVAQDSFQAHNADLISFYQLRTPVDYMQAQGFFDSGVMPVVAGYITYSNWPIENYQAQGFFDSGSLT